MRFAYRSFLSVVPFQIIGPNRGSFYVHSALIAQHSKRFDRAVNGGMKEAEEHTIKIEDNNGDITDGTVARFIEYAYTGDYTVPTPAEAQEEWMQTIGYESPDEGTVEETAEISVVPPEDERITDTSASVHPDQNQAGDSFEARFGTPPDQPAPEVFDWSSLPPSSKKSKKDKKKKRHSVRRDAWVGESISNRAASNSLPPAALSNYSTLTTHEKRQRMWDSFVAVASMFQNKPKTWEPRAIEPNQDDYAPDLLCHARMYVFSNQYECAPLADLALEKLRLTLAIYDPTEESAPVGPIVDLTRYTYVHTYDYPDGCDRLRYLVVEYLACHLEKMMANKNFHRLVRDTTNLAADLLTKALERME